MTEKLIHGASLEDEGSGAISQLKGITLELLQGARNLIKYARIKEQMEVAILASRGQDDDVINAIVIAAEEVGAHVTVIRARGRMERYDFPGLIEEPPRVVQKSLLGADVIIEAGIRSMYASGTRYMDKMFMKMARSEYGAFLIRSELLSKETMSSEFGRLPCDIIYEF